MQRELLTNHMSQTVLETATPHASRDCGATLPASCRVCGAAAIHSLGELEFHKGHAARIYHCDACGCRFSPHNPSFYQELHSQPRSSYVRYRGLADRCRELFSNGDLQSLCTLLCEVPKYRMVIEALANLPPGSKVLEIGCARGFLTSYFILGGWRALGVDVSAEAIASAGRDFGDQFALPGSDRIGKMAPYDAIFHVGTIGCVEQPVQMNRALLALLKPGGVLVFNAPNVDACVLRGQWWLDSATPPDLVTLFKPGVWSRLFKGDFEVIEAVDPEATHRNLQLRLRRLFLRVWQPPEPVEVSESATVRLRQPTLLGRAWNLWERLVVRAALITNLADRVPKLPCEFGLFVTIRRNAVGVGSER